MSALWDASLTLAPRLLCEVVRRRRASGMQAPEQCVRQFIAAHSAWEVRATDRAKPLRPGSGAYQSAVA